MTKTEKQELVVTAAKKYIYYYNNNILWQRNNDDERYWIGHLCGICTILELDMETLYLVNEENKKFIEKIIFKSRKTRKEIFEVNTNE